MASISKLQIQGMRSFGPDPTDRQNVAFFSPLTLILGQNGCGKTTIIECLKYVTTGDVPPGAGKGASFVHDPKMARETCVKGQVKLAFNGVGNTCKIISRSIEASQKLKTIQVKTLDSTITDKTNPANHIQISSKCADINAEMFSCLGVSKPILNYVIFCHQEDSNWPLDVGSNVKDRFDEIFNSAKYKKCLKNIKDVRKTELDKAKIDKNDMEHYKSDKQYADQKNKELLRKEDELVKIEAFIDEVTKDLGPLKDKYKDIQQEEDGFSSIQKKLAEAETSLLHCQNERESLQNTIKEVIDESKTDEDIKAKMNGLQLESKKKETLVEDLKENLDEIKGKIDKGEKSVQVNAAKIGKAVSERDQHQKNVSEIDALRQTADKELDIVDDGNDLMSNLNKEDTKIKNQIKQLKAEHKKMDDKVEEEIDQIKGLKTGLEAGKKREQVELISHKKEIAQLKRQLNDLEGAAEMLERIKEEWKEGNQKIETEKGKHDREALHEEIDQEKETVKSLDVSAVKLRDESRTLEEKQSSLQRITHLSEEIEVKETKMQRTLNKRNSDFLQLFGEVPDLKRLRNTFRDSQEKAESSLKEMESKRKRIETETNGRRILKRDLTQEIDKKSARLQQLESKVGDHLGPDEELEAEIVRITENLANSRKELQVKEAGKFTYREMIERMREMSQPACPTCNRGFNKPNEPGDLIEELTELINEIPNKVRSLDNKVNKLTTRLETLQKIRPEVHSLKQIKLELQEGKSKVEELDKEIRKFESDLEDQEEDWNITEVNVALFKQVAEDVQTVDNLNKDLSLLRQKKSDLSLECGTEVGSGARTLETVREEEEQVALKLRSARRNLEQCQETLNKHTAMLNNLEASQNRLTNRKLEIEGQQQQRAATVAKRDELEDKTRKCMAEVQRCDRELEPLHEQLEITEEKKVLQRRKAEEEINGITEKERKVDKLIGEAVRLEKAIEHYNGSGKEEEFDKFKKEKVKHEEIMRVLKEDRSNVETNLKKVEKELFNQDGQRRHYEDNLRFREYKAQEKRHRKTVENQQDILEQMDYKKVEQKKNEVVKQINKLSSERSEKEGQITELKRSVKELERELNSPKLRDAARKFKEKSIEHSLRTKVGEDLNKYYIALNWAIMNFHKEKMKNINKVIRELWRSTYRGNDIDYIEIKTEDGEVTSGAEKRTTYNYRVVMVKNDTEMDMRGRCSAGQKVLSSLIIRLALAETFSTNCGIIALDEPTTNLDRENIESLALALSEIVTRRAQQRNFQLVVITHDEEFIELLSRCGQLQHYQKVSRNSRGLSEIRKYDISSLEEAS